MFTRASALEFGRHGIRVNAVSPGVIHREGIETNWPDGVRRWMEAVPLGRMGDDDDVANAVLFLVAPASAPSSPAPTSSSTAASPPVRRSECDDGDPRP